MDSTSVGTIISFAYEHGGPLTGALVAILSSALAILKTFFDSRKVKGLFKESSEALEEVKLSHSKEIEDIKKIFSRNIEIIEVEREAYMVRRSSLISNCNQVMYSTMEGILNTFKFNLINEIGNDIEDNKEHFKCPKDLSDCMVQDKIAEALNKWHAGVLAEGMSDLISNTWKLLHPNGYYKSFIEGDIKRLDDWINTSNGVFHTYAWELFVNKFPQNVYKGLKRERVSPSMTKEVLSNIVHQFCDLKKNRDVEIAKELKSYEARIVNIVQSGPE